MIGFTKGQRLEIGKRIHLNEMYEYDAASEYDINWHTDRDYMWEYSDIHSLPPMKIGPRLSENSYIKRVNYSNLGLLTKE